MLSSMDDYPIHQTAAPIAHVGTSDRNFYDRYYFNLHGSTDELFMVIGMGQYPNLGDAGCIRVRVLGRQAAGAARVEGARRPYGHDGRPAPDRGGRAASQGARARGVDRAPARVRPDVDRRDSRVRRTAALHPFARTRHVRQSPLRADRDSGKGPSRSRERPITVTPDRWKGRRDRSWGIRPVGETEPPGIREGVPSIAGMWNYTPMQFDDYSILYIVQEDPNGERDGRGGRADLERSGPRSRGARSTGVRAHARARHAHDAQAVTTVVPRRAGRRLRHRR